MKILVAINNPKDAKVLGNTTLSWAPRAGYNMRIFLPDDSKGQEYIEILSHVNYREYLDLHPAMLLVGYDPESYAREHGFDLLLTLPDNLKRWNNRRNKDRMVIDYVSDVGAARLNMAEAKPGEISNFENGATLKKL